MLQKYTCWSYFFSTCITEQFLLDTDKLSLSLSGLGIQILDQMFHGPELDVSLMVVVDYVFCF